MRILFAGNPEIAIPSLAALVKPSLKTDRPPFEVCALLTNPDRVKGRDTGISPTALSAAATALSAKLAERGLPAIVQLKPESFAIEPAWELATAIHAMGIDLLVSFAYGRMFPAAFLKLFKQGGINVHPSLLPKYRGATPLQQAILDGAKESGITIQRISTEMDAGAILAQERFPLTGSETSTSLFIHAAWQSAALLRDVTAALAQGTARETAQDETQATWCTKINREDGLIGWHKSARALDAQIRAFTPWPLSWTFHNGRELYVLAGGPLPSAGTEQAGIVKDAPPGFVQRADRKDGIVVQTGDGLFNVTRLQYQTKKALDWRDFLNGARLKAGDMLGV